MGNINSSKRNSSSLFLLTLSTVIALFTSGIAYAEKTDKPLSLKIMSESVKEWNLLKGDVIAINNENKALLNSNDNKSEPLLVVNQGQLSLLEISESVKEWNLLKGDVKRLVVTNNDTKSKPLLVVSPGQLSLLEMSDSIKEWNLLQSDVKNLISAEKDNKKQVKDIIEPAITPKVVESVITPKAISKNSGQWGVQIGAYLSIKDTESAAKSFYQQFANLKGTTSTYRESITKEVTGEEIVRLKIGTFTSRKIANEQCNKLKQKSFDCFPAKLVGSTLINQ